MVQKSPDSQVDVKFFMLRDEASQNPEEAIQEFENRGWIFVQEVPSPSPRSVGFQFRRERK